MVPNVTVDESITINGNIVTRLRLSWGEPFNNFDPIVNYTVSYSSDGRCPPNFTTTGNTVLLGNLTTMTTYTFSVVATNSIGSGEAGVVMITTPGNVIYSIITSSEGIKLRYMCWPSWYYTAVYHMYTYSILYGGYFKPKSLRKFPHHQFTSFSSKSVYF